MSSNMALLCHYGGIIVDRDNNITHNRESNVILSVRLKISLVKLK